MEKKTASIETSEQKRTAGIVEPTKNPGPFIARVIKHADPYYLGGLEVELLKTTEAGNVGETLGQTAIVYYASPFYGVTGAQHLGKNDSYSNTQKSYGWWAVPPDPGTLVLVTFVEGSREFGYWFACIPEKGMTYMLPGGQPATEQTSGNIPKELKGKKLPVGEYNKKITKPSTNNVVKYKRPVNEDFVNILKEQGTVEDDIRGITTTSAQREFPSAVYGFSSPGPLDKRGGSPQGKVGIKESQATVHTSRLGSSSIVIDDGDDKFLRKGSPEDTPYEYVNKEASEAGGDVTRPANEMIRFRTRTGAQIMINTSEDLIYINNSRGTAWIEMSSNGKLDVYAKDSISFHTETDFNFVADRDINFEAGRNVNMIVNENIYTSCGLNYELLVGVDGKLKFKNNLDTTVTNDMKTHVLNDKDIVVGNDMKTRVANDKSVLVGNDLFETANNDISILAQNRLSYNGIAGVSGFTSGNMETTVNGYQHLYISDELRITTGAQQHYNSGAGVLVTSAGDQNYKVGGQYNMTASGTSNIRSSHHKETANRIDMNGPPAASAATASTANSIEQGPEALEAVEAVLPIKAKFPQRVPQHEPWQGHENWNPLETAPDKTQAVETESQDIHMEERPVHTDRTLMNELKPEDD